MTKNFFAGAHAVIMVYAVDSNNSFKSLDDHLHNVDNYCKQDVIKIICGNKCDLETERRVTFDDLQEKATELGTKYFETSALEEKKGTIFEMFGEISVLLCQSTMMKSGSFKLDRPPNK